MHYIYLLLPTIESCTFAITAKTTNMDCCVMPILFVGRCELSLAKSVCAYSSHVMSRHDRMQMHIYNLFANDLHAKLRRVTLLHCLSCTM